MGILTDTKIYKERPADKRLPKEERTYDLLDKLGIGYERADHLEAKTIADCGEVDALLGVNMCKNLLLCNSQKTKFYLLMLPGEKKFKTKDLSNQIGSARLSFADGSFMEQFLDITPGALSVLGLMNDKDKNVRLLIDKEVLEGEYMGVHPCVNTSSLKIKTSELLEKFLPYTEHDYTVVEL